MAIQDPADLAGLGDAHAVRVSQGSAQQVGRELAVAVLSKAISVELDLRGTELVGDLAPRFQQTIAQAGATATTICRLRVT